MSLPRYNQDSYKYQTVTWKIFKIVILLNYSTIAHYRLLTRTLPYRTRPYQYQLRVKRVWSSANTVRNRNGTETSSSKVLYKKKKALTVT